jgi:hypothetical protein
MHQLHWRISWKASSTYDITGIMQHCRMGANRRLDMALHIHDD